MFDPHPNLTRDVIHGLGWIYLILALMNLAWTIRSYNHDGHVNIRLLGLLGKGQQVPVTSFWGLYTLMLFMVSAVHLTLFGGSVDDFHFRLPLVFKENLDELAYPVYYFGLSVALFAAMIALRKWLVKPTVMAIWAITVGSNMARATPFLGYEGPGAQILNVGGFDLITSASDARFMLLGGRFVGEATLNRFYILHCVAIPLVAAGLIAIHFWRVRKDGGISQPL